jgi:outer membrane protein TolC
MVVAGNWSQARLMREQLTLAREQAALWQARQSALEAEEQLARLMGQWHPQAIDALMQRLPAQLPGIPAQPRPAADLAESDIEATVLHSHPTLAVQRTAVLRQLAALDPAWRDTWTQSVQAGLRTLPSDGLPNTVLAITDPRLANDHALQRALASESALLQTATERRSAARTAWARLQTTHALARQAQEVTLPLQTALEQETLLRYNGMLQSTWELLEASRERMQAASDAATARRDFWLARLDLDHLLAGGDHAPADPSPATAGARRAASTAGH